MEQIKSFLSIFEPLYRTLWHTELQAKPAWQAYLIRWIRMLWLLVRELSEGQLTMRAMSLVYTTLLSLVPMLAVSFSVLKAFGVQNQLEPVLLNFLAPLGPKGNEISATIIGFVDNMRVGVLGSVGLGMLLYTVISLIQKVERAFNYTWHVSQNRPFIERFSDYLSVLLIGPVLVFSAIGATASIMSTTLVQGMAHIPALGWIIDSVGTLIPYLFVISAFTFAYLFVPNTRVRLGPAMVGALVAGILWQSIGWGFASFVVGSTKYAAIYSGFAILLLFMIWLYLAWLILLIGASIAFYQQHPEYLNSLSDQRQGPGHRVKEWIGLYSLCLIAKHHFEGAPPPSVEQLALRLGTMPEPVQQTLDLLQAQGLLIALNSSPESYLPAIAPENIKVQTVLSALRRNDEQPPEQLSTPLAQALADVFSMVEEATAERLHGLTLRELVLDPRLSSHIDRGTS